MKILYLGLFRFPEGDAAASRVLNNIRIFRDLGHSIHVLSFGGKYREEDCVEGRYIYDNISYKISNDIDTHSWSERILRYTYPYPNARRIIRSTIKEYDILIVYNNITNEYVFAEYL